ncbi:hypothetical protein INT47_008942 [Mucor saturninus]|uniref:DUF6729 domain-containing protein n=1 Tax=Mucor saturninus TaxID=64648 RepID=A0A8H7V0S0_9FUNG|nr:hypothetical protein INT47_008942 [Mucor saturninus]
MFSGSSSDKNEGIPKRPKRMMNQPNLNLQRLDQMSLFQTGSGREQDQSMSTFSYGNVGSTMHIPVAEDIQNIQIENNVDPIVVESEQNVVEGTESDEEEMVGDVTNISDDYANTAAEQELTEEEFEIIDEQVGNSTPEDSFVGKYVTEIQNRLKGGVTPIEYQRKTYWVNVEYEGFDYNTRKKKYLKCPDCKTGKLERKEFVKKTKARRIIDQFDCFYLMSMNYRCTQKSYKKTFSGYDQNIAKQLNPCHQRAFPAQVWNPQGSIQYNATPFSTRCWSP